MCIYKIIMDITAVDGGKAWFTREEQECLLRVVTPILDAVPLQPYLQALHAVQSAIAAECSGIGTMYHTGDIRDTVLLSVLAQLRSSVREALQTETTRMGIVQPDRVRFGKDTAKTRSRYPFLFRIYAHADGPLTLAQRRRVYAQLTRTYAALQAVVPANVDVAAIRAGIARECPREFHGWTVAEARLGPQRIKGYVQLHEDDKDSFRIVSEDDGLAYKGERVVAEVQSPRHKHLRRLHAVYEDDTRRQYNFMVDLPVVLLMHGPRGARRAVSVPLSLLDFTIFDRDLDWAATRPRDAKRVYALVPTRVRVHSLSPLGWCLREAALGSAARAGAFFGFWWVDGPSAVDRARLEDLDRVCAAFRMALPGLPSAATAPEVRRLLAHASWADMRAPAKDAPLQMPLAVAGSWAKRAKDGFRAPARVAMAHDFYAALRMVTDALLASHVLSQAPAYEVTHVTADSIADTFY